MILNTDFSYCGLLFQQTSYNFFGWLGLLDSVSEQRNLKPDTYSWLMQRPFQVVEWNQEHAISILMIPQFEFIKRHLQIST